MCSILSQLLAAGMLLVSCYTDVKYRKVFNKITFPCMVLGLMLAGFPTTIESYARIGWLFVFFILGSTGLMGMGDLKLSMAILCLRGIEETFQMLITGIFLNLLFCFITDPRTTIAAIKSVLDMFLFRTKLIRYSKKDYPFAVSLTIGYFVTIVIRRCFLL